MQKKPNKRLNFFQRRRIFKKTNFLDLTPVKKNFKTQLIDNKIILFVPKFKNVFLNKLFFANSEQQYYRIRLDDYGSATWQLIDGQKNNAQICEELKKIFGNNIQAIEERLSKFLSILYEQRYISFKEIEPDI